jgi:hypothetical protein
LGQALVAWHVSGTPRRWFRSFEVWKALIKRDCAHKKLYPELIGRAVLSGDKSEAPSAENSQGERSSTRVHMEMMIG